MRFPGEKYLVYAQDPIAADADSYVRHGVDRFLFATDGRGLMPGDVAALRDAFTAAGRGFEMVFAVRHPAIRVVCTPGRDPIVTEEGLWSLGEPIERLTEIAECHEMVYIRNTLRPMQLVFASDRSVDGFALRELWEWMHYRRDRDRPLIVPFGIFNRELFYGFGADGSAVRTRTPERRLQARLVAPDSSVYSINDIPSFLGVEKYPRIKERIEIAISYLPQVPIRFKEFYESMKRGVDWRSVDPDLGELEAKLRYFERVSKSPPIPLVGDKRLCDACSVKYACKLYKERSVCVMPGTDGKRFSDLIGSRDSDDVIDGVAVVLRAQADRTERMLEAELEAQDAAAEAGRPPEFSPEVSKALNDLQRNAASYAKLINPMLTRPAVALQVNAGAAPQVEKLHISEITPRDRSRAIRELEQSGHSRNEITTDMVYDHIAKAKGKVLEGEIVDGVRNDF